MANVFIPDPEDLGRKRFPDNKGFRKSLSQSSSNILSALQSLLPSNYSKDTSPNLAIFNNVQAREMGRLLYGINDINNNSQYSETEAKFLQQVLGERLFLGSNLAPVGYNSENYRDYLISLKNAFLAGSKKSDIEAIASKYTGQQINIKELYLKIRDPGSSLDISSTHKMVVDVLIDSLVPGQNIDQLLGQLDFFINLVRPAHVLYDTRLIWKEMFDVNKTVNTIFGDKGGGCVPLYNYLPTSEPIWLAQQIFILPSSEGATGQIDSIHSEDLLFYLADSTKVITEPGVNGTKVYNITGHRVAFESLEIGQFIQMNYLVIPGDFQFWWLPPELAANPVSWFYKDILRSPLFQENVKKIMDANGRFPLQIKDTPTTICDKWVHDLMQPLYEDTRRQCRGQEHSGTSDFILRNKMGFPKHEWQYPASEIYDEVLLGNDYILFTPDTPLTDGSGNPATVNDVTVIFDGTALSDSIDTVDASSGRISLTESEPYWHSNLGHFPVPGNEVSFGYHYLNDGTNVDATSSSIFGISYWQLPHAPIVQGDSTGDLAGVDNVFLSVDGTSISNAVSKLDPLLAHVTLESSSDFWNASELGRAPQVGDSFEFEFKWGERYEYSMILDDPGRVLDGYEGSLSYGVVFDGEPDKDSATSAVVPPDPLELGYRYRTYLLHHSSVLNSPDTLLLNNYQKPAKRASIVNQMDVLNHFNKFFSGEFLEDKDPVDVPKLSDAYLENGLDPILKLKEGTPPFQKTFEAGHNGLIYHQKLQDIRKNHHPLIYSDLLLKEFEESGESVPLNSICDSDRISFKMRMGEDAIKQIQECSPWILFDTIEDIELDVSIPSEMIGVPNLRVENQHLRENFVLREIESSGTSVYSYEIFAPQDRKQVVYNLPESFQIPYEGDVIDFPSLPVMKDSMTLAGPEDIDVKVNGVLIPGVVKSLDPVTGTVELFPIPSPYRIDDYITITDQDLINREIMLSGWPYEPHNISMNVIRGTSQYINKDFYIYGQKLSWKGGPLEGLLRVGDLIRITYVIDPLVNVPIEFIYRILSDRTVTVADTERSRIFDYKYVFDGGCPDIESVSLDFLYNEYFNFLDDYSSGIKMKFFDTETSQVEEHVFSGPVFEYYDSSEDQIGAPQNFPNSLIKITGPNHATNPLNYTPSYDFMNDLSVRFRKKTFKELLPDRTFRTVKVTEMMAI